MKRVLLPLLSLSMISIVAHAGKGAFTGSASLSHPAEFTIVNFSVKSECYASPSEAMKNNNKAVIEIQEFIKPFIDSSNGIDRLISNGGFTSAYSRTIYDDNRPITVCRNTFQQTTEVIFKTANVAGFSRIFAAIQEKVLGTFAAGETEGVDAITFVNIGSPSADLCQKTKAAMVLEALDLAAADAKAKFGICAQRCGIDLQRTSITAVNDLSRVSHSKSSYMERSPASDEPVVETNFDHISVSADVTINFSYPDASYACDLSLDKQ